MILLSPVSSYESAVLQVDSGANEIYVGLKSSMFKRYSFSGRGQVSNYHKNVAPEKEELKRIVEYAHAHDVVVSLTANIPMFSEYKQEDFENKFIQYVLDGVDCGVDNVIVADIGLIYKLSKLNLPVNIHASTFLDTMSVEQLHFLKSLGVTRAVLTYQIGMEEVIKLCKANLLEIEIFCYLSCSFFNGACNFVHDMGENNVDEGISIGVPCKAQYKISSNGVEEANIPFFDAELTCGLCAVKKLMDIGVDVIKIAGRDRNPDMVSKVTTLFRNAIDIAKESSEEEYIEKLKEYRYPWWKRMYCRTERCKYKDNEISKSYIGLWD